MTASGGPRPGAGLADVTALARDVFGYPELREVQRRALEPVLAGRDTLAVLATGSGKSAVYQLAGLSAGGLTVVVSPLVALQRDQLRGLQGRRMPDGRPIRAAQLNATVHVAEARAARAAVAAGELDFLLLGPEQLARPATRELLATTGRPCALLVVDEAHLVSEWGFDFRPDYLQLTDARQLVGDPQVLALTATAAPPVQAEITRRLGMRDPAVVVAGFDRPNIDLAVRAVHGTTTHDKVRGDDVVVDEVLAGPTPALVYAASRRHCEELAERFRHLVFTAAPYHAGLPAAERSATQDAFLSGSLDVVVATSAFGLGIDKPDVRSVVHASPPGSLDEYYQEIGRAGRDGRPARAVLVFNPADLRLPRMFAAAARVRDGDVDAVLSALTRATGPIPLTDLAQHVGLGTRRAERVVERLADAGAAVLHDGVVVPHVAEGEQAHRTTERTHDAEEIRQAVAASRIDAISYYAETMHCRRTELLAYFGEQYTPPCGTCDNDRRPAPRTLHGLARPNVVAAAGQGRAPVDPGSRVEHTTWGGGTVLEADPHQLLVVFDTVGYRHLTPAALTTGLLRVVAGD
ncbi:RecQ family ATP-dependent DNA helicase [Pseudonocardia xinjiangensis]|uniref:ATP-dependent DNA helicase RecQ n=1 Tax=Pseudonocardia xinjiangensis TaxID=75289 RepID=A0ABX1RML0_9PSEU|nr:RecQ family ATP-dependent DNA helicase [Pseudonocardia xinjiangensis]NMH80864.1 ATP-dependent DNA helicase RecQ [Pseudonocardia xinjiangensis]